MSAYRKPLPYRKAQAYRSDPPIPAVPINTASCGDLWGPATASNRVLAFPAPPAGKFNDTVRAEFGAIAAHGKPTSAEWNLPAAHARDESVPWGTLATHARSRAERWRVPDPHQRDSALPFGDLAEHPARSTAADWVQPAPGQRNAALPYGTLTPRERSISTMWAKLISAGAVIALPWGPIGSRSAPVAIDWPVDPDPGTGPDAPPLTVPIQAVYMMIPTLEAVVLPSGVSVPVLSATISCDLNSWAWTLSAAMSASGLALVNPADSATPAVIQISINGYIWTFRVEGVDDNRRFGSKTLTIRGRSLSADLAAPYAHLRTYTATADENASQLATDELTPYSGWSLVWDSVDWLVPGGTFSYQDLAPIDAISRVAASIGGAVLTDPAAKVLTVLPQYPVSPWAWPAATPYAILPASIITQGDGSWQGGTNANGIYVYAENAGYGALVKLTGSDGAVQVPMIVEKLTVSADPVRERGRVELARAGRVKHETRVIPLFPSPADPGLIPLGKLLEITDSSTETWRGQVMSVRINAERAGSAISVRQTLGLERQFRT